MKEVSVLKMNFESEKLREILINFYNLTHVRFSMYDDEFNKIVAFPEESCDFCTMMKSNAESKALLVVYCMLSTPFQSFFSFF